LNKDIKSSLGFCIKDPWVLFLFYFFFITCLLQSHLFLVILLIIHFLHTVDNLIWLTQNYINLRLYT
jgi:hypothetical protein